MSKNSEVISKYLADTGLSISDFAQVLKVHSCTVWRWLNKEDCGIPLRKAKLIERKTNRKIQVKDLCLSDYGFQAASTMQEQQSSME